MAETERRNLKHGISKIFVYVSNKSHKFSSRTKVNLMTCELGLITSLIQAKKKESLCLRENKMKGFNRSVRTKDNIQLRVQLLMPVCKV